MAKEDVTETTEETPEAEAPEAPAPKDAEKPGAEARAEEDEAGDDSEPVSVYKPDNVDFEHYYGKEATGEKGGTAPGKFIWEDGEAVVGNLPEINAYLHGELANIEFDDPEDVPITLREGQPAGDKKPANDTPEKDDQPKATEKPAVEKSVPNRLNPNKKR